VFRIDKLLMHGEIFLPIRKLFAFKMSSETFLKFGLVTKLVFVFGNAGDQFISETNLLD